MNILVTVNQKYFIMLKDLLLSLSFFNEALNIYFFYDNIDNDEIQNLKEFVENNKIGKLYSYCLKLDISLPHHIDYISKETYFRLYAPYYLPLEMDRILYLDADIICSGSLSNLYNMDFDGNVLIGCENFDGNNYLYKKRLDLHDSSPYINAGVLLINLVLYRKFITQENLNHYIAQYSGILLYQDQDVINKLFEHYIKVVDCKYNYQINMVVGEFKERVLTHYTTAKKPWLDNYNRKKYAIDFYNFLDQSKSYDRLEQLKAKHTVDDIDVSIIVPVYNVEKYLPKCLDSLIYQKSLKLEIILIDDGSTDSSGRICDYYGRLDKRIIVIHQKNEGLSAARNKGLILATGRYVGFVDSDDYIDSNMYKIMYSYVKHYKLDIVVCNFYHLYPNQKTIKDKENSSNKMYFKQKDILIEVLADKTIKNFIWSKLYKREIFYHIRFPVNKLYEDIFVSLSIAEQAKNVLYIQDALYYYRHRNDSISKAKNMMRIESAIENTYYRYQEINQKYNYLKDYNVASMLNRICCEYFENQYFLDNHYFFYKFENIINDVLGEYFKYKESKNSLKLDYDIDLFIKQFHSYLLSSK